MLASSLSLGHSFIASFAGTAKGKSITLGVLTFSDHGTKDAEGRHRERVKYAAQHQHPDQHLDFDIPPKGKVVVEMTFPSSGVVRFFCKFHSAKGMNGELLTGDANPQAVSPPSRK
jgi:hypothetical protein